MIGSFSTDADRESEVDTIGIVVTVHPSSGRSPESRYEAFARFRLDF
jgi:hypothetical protein